MPPNCMDSILDHGLIIRVTHNLVEEEKKGSVVGRGRPVGKNVETRVENIRSKEGMKEEQ
jgi:hypothetical protein